MAPYLLLALLAAQPPSFELPDQGGRKQTLDTLMGPRGLVVVFFRSADW